MQTDNFIISLDVGTQYIKASALSVTDQSVIHGSREETKGITKEGQILPMELGEAIKNVINKLEGILNRKVKSAYVSVPMDFVRLMEAEGHSIIVNGHVTQQELNHSVDGAKRVFHNQDEEVIDFIMSKIMIDETLYKNPCGIKGEKLSVYGQAVLGQRGYIKALQEAMNNAGILLAGFGLGQMGAASLLLSKKDMRDGVILVDTGASSTQMTLFKNQRIHDFSSIKMSGKNITKDISIVLKKTLLEAESLKKAYGKGQRDFTDIDGKLLEEVIEARINEIMGYVEEFMKKHEVVLPYKVVIYGGGLCGFINIHNLYKSDLKQSTNFITSDIIRDDTVLHIQSSGIAYRLLSEVSCEDSKQSYSNLMDENDSTNGSVYNQQQKDLSQSYGNERYRDDENQEYEEKRENKFVMWIKKMVKKIKNN